MGSVDEVVGRMIEALDQERDAVREAVGRLATLTALVFEGARGHAEPGAYRYRFGCELGLPLPEGTALQLTAPGLSTAGEVVDHDPALGVLDCVVRHDLGQAVAEADLSFDPSHLLELLAGRLEAIASHPEQHQAALALRFLGGDASAPSQDRRPVVGLSAVQAAAVRFAMGSQVAYVWGPPGTGKTRTAAHLVGELIARGERVLLVAQTNVACDNALLAVLQAGNVPKAPSLGPLIRVGWHGEALEPYGVSLDQGVEDALQAGSDDRLSDDLRAICRRVEAYLGRGAPPGTLLRRRFRVAADTIRGFDLPDDEQAETLRADLSGARRRLAELERVVVRGASVVATTLTRLYTSPALQGLRVEAVVLDEASAATLPQCLVAACMARRRAIAVGDFVQLPAVVVADTAQTRLWLKRSVFESAGCADPMAAHPLRIMLDEQWRMHPQIAGLVGEMFYAGRLQTAPARAAGAAAGEALVLVDSSTAGARSERASGSKRNPRHAAIVRALVAAAPDRPVAVIAPYRAQVRLLRDELRLYVPRRLISGQVEVFTVHRFQGRDKAVVIVDLTDAPGTACRFLDDASNPDAPRLLDVAFSRARRGLIVLGHVEHLVARLGQGSLVARLFARLRMRGGVEVEWADRLDQRSLLGRLGTW